MSKPELAFDIADYDRVGPVMIRAYDAVVKGLAAGPVVVTLGRKRRSLDQNKKMWPMLSDVSKQVVWHGMQLEPHDWKDMFTASLKKQRVVPAIDDGFVALGGSTKKLSREQFSMLIELIYAFGAEKGVTWSEPALKCYETYREAA